MEQLGDRPILSHVIRRVAAAKRVDEVVVATTDLENDQVVQQLCRAEDVHCIRGPSQDVLTRYHLAAIASRADVVVRITADCPLISPLLVDEIVEARSSSDVDYASNTLRRTYPHGLDVEVITLKALLNAVNRASLDFDREHVTTFIYNHPQDFSLWSYEGSTDWSWLRWTVDYPEDLDFLRILVCENPDILDPSSHWLGHAERIITSPRLLQAHSLLHSR